MSKKADNTQTALISEKLNDFYTASSEEERLLMGLGPMEFERNKDLISKYFYKASLNIADVGGGTGRYAEWLAGLGHRVILLEPVEKHIKLAEKRAKKVGRRFTVLRGEARKLELATDSIDLLILHGPLYHLQDREERLKAIREALRVTRPGGTILGFGINYTASTVVALLQGAIHHDDIYRMCLSELTTGVHEAPADLPGILAEAYYHRPEELKEEFEECGLLSISLHAVEGISWLDKDFFGTRADPQKYSRLLELLRLTESDRNLMALSPHMMISGQVPL